MVKIHNTAKDKILKFMLSNKEQEFTIRAIAKNTAIDYKSAYLTINGLIEEKIINAKKVGQAVLCSINTKAFNSDVYRAETIRREELLKNKNIHAMTDYFNNIKPFFIMLLYGSYAKGNQTKSSDIDIMLITDDNTINKQIKNKISLIPLNIHLTDFTSKEFISMLKTTDLNVGKEATSNNIILFGIEDYHRLLKNT